MRVTNIRQHFPTIGRGKKINVVKIVHLNVYCPIVKIFISSARYFVKGVDVHVEVQRVVLGKFQGVESFCWDTTETKNWGTSIGYWWWSHFGQIPSFLEWIWKLKKPKICSTPAFKHNCNDGMQPKFGVHGGGQTLEKEEYSTKGMSTMWRMMENPHIAPTWWNIGQCCIFWWFLEVVWKHGIC